MLLSFICDGPSFVTWFSSPNMVLKCCDVCTIFKRYLVNNVYTGYIQHKHILYNKLLICTLLLWRNKKSIYHGANNITFYIKLPNIYRHNKISYSILLYMFVSLRFIHNYAFYHEIYKVIKLMKGKALRKHSLHEPTNKISLDSCFVWNHYKQISRNPCLYNTNLVLCFQGICQFDSVGL